MNIKVYYILYLNSFEYNMKGLLDDVDGWFILV